MPKRDRSKREFWIAMYSMAQQARPKVTGHIEFLRAQSIRPWKGTTMTWPRRSSGTRRLCSMTSSAGRGAA